MGLVFFFCFFVGVQEKRNIYFTRKEKKKKRKKKSGNWDLISFPHCSSVIGFFFFIFLFLKHSIIHTVKSITMQSFKIGQKTIEDTYTLATSYKH